jgi:hypothetical protein
MHHARGDDEHLSCPGAASGRAVGAAADGACRFSTLRRARGQWRVRCEPALPLPRSHCGPYPAKRFGAQGKGKSARDFRLAWLAPSHYEAGGGGPPPPAPPPRPRAAGAGGPARRAARAEQHGAGAGCAFSEVRSHRRPGRCRQRCTPVPPRRRGGGPTRIQRAPKGGAEHDAGHTRAPAAWLRLAGNLGTHLPFSLSTVASGR